MKIPAQYTQCTLKKSLYVLLEAEVLKLQAPLATLNDLIFFIFSIDTMDEKISCFRSGFQCAVLTELGGTRTFKWWITSKKQRSDAVLAQRSTLIP